MTDHVVYQEGRCPHDNEPLYVLTGWPSVSLFCQSCGVMDSKRLVPCRGCSAMIFFGGKNGKTPINPKTGANHFIDCPAAARFHKQAREAKHGPAGDSIVTHQPRDLFDLAAAQQARDTAIEQVGENADQDWKDRAIETVHGVCVRHREFTPDDVWLAGLEKPREARALGAVMGMASRRGWCRTTGRVTTTAQVSQHKNVVTVWESLIYEGRS